MLSEFVVREKLKSVFQRSYGTPMNPEVFQPKLVSELNLSWEPKLLSIKSSKKKNLKPARRVFKTSDPRRLLKEFESD